MTLPYERYRAIKYVREFLRELLGRVAVPRTRKEWTEIRMQARSALKHYPWETDMERARKKAPDVWGEKDE